MPLHIHKPQQIAKTLRYLLAAAVLVAFVGLLVKCLSPDHGLNPNTSDTTTEPTEDPARYFMGIRIDTLDMHEGRVPNGSSLSTLLGHYGVSALTIDRTARISKPVFDVRHMVAGHQYIGLCTRDSLPRLRYFLYRESLTDFVVFNFNDSISVYRSQKEVCCRQQSCQGVIKSSLWQSLQDNHSNVNLTFALSDIYAWQIDFFAIQSGDYYKVLYDEYFIDDSVSVGLGDIHAALFHSGGRDYYAIPFVQDGYRDYFDAEGVNLRRAFLKAPLKYSRISSKFSNGRMHPVLRIRRPHHGVDYAAPSGTPVMSIGAGVVVKKGYQKNGGGNYVTIKHNGTYTTTYMHLKGFAKGLAVGQKVSQGEVIGYVGSTGLSTGPHLDFRVYMNGQAIDPLKMESPPSVPLKACYRDSFMLVKDSLVQCISRIS